MGSEMCIRDSPEGVKLALSFIDQNYGSIFLSVPFYHTDALPHVWHFLRFSSFEFYILNLYLYITC